MNLGDNMANERKDLKPEMMWNVNDLYSTWDDWEKDLKKLVVKNEFPKWPAIHALKEKFKVSSKLLKELLDLFFSNERLIDKLFTYAHLRLDEDVASDQAKNAYGKILAIAHDFNFETSWIEPQILEIEEGIFKNYLNADELKPYLFHLEKIYRLKPHTLTIKEEELLSLSSKSLDSVHKAFSALNDADLKFEKIKDANNCYHELTNGLYSNYLRQKDRILRENAFNTLHNTYLEYENTLAELLQGQLINHTYISKAKKYKNCLDSALNAHNIDPKVYYNLIEIAKNKLPSLHRYISIRKKIMNLDEIHLYDLYAPLIDDVGLEWDYESACNLVIDSVALLGKEYQDILRKGLLKDRWVDPFENARKRSGAYSSGCYDSMPYILMNFHGSLNDVLTLAHEAGHSMHSYLSRENQNYQDSQYPIFVAEVASTFNEQLLLQHLMQKYDDPKIQAFLLNYKIEGIRTTFFRQVMFADLELKMHEWVENHIPLTPTFLKIKYLELNKEFFGPDITIDDNISIEWARIPHFYYNFYVYQYSTGISAAMSLFKNANISEKARLDYLKFLKSGGSKYPLDLLKLAGVDLLKTDAINATLCDFDNLLDELEVITENEQFGISAN
jgi:oligoendopeptidase F